MTTIEEEAIGLVRELRDYVRHTDTCPTLKKRARMRGCTCGVLTVLRRANQFLSALRNGERVDERS